MEAIVSTACFEAFEAAPAFVQASGASLDEVGWSDEAKRCVANAGTYLLFDSALRVEQQRLAPTLQRVLGNVSFAKQREIQRIGVCAPAECSSRDGVGLAWQFLYRWVLEPSRGRRKSRIQSRFPLPPGAHIRGQLATVESIAEAEELERNSAAPPQKKTLGLLPRPFVCPGQGEVPKRAEALRTKLSIAARSGFDPQMLAYALDDAEFLEEKWKPFGLRTGRVSQYLVQGAVPDAADAFARQLFGAPSAKPGADTHCLFAHLAAAFVVARLTPLLHARQELSGDGTPVAAWVSRVARRGRKLRLPFSLALKVRDKVSFALLLTGKSRVLDSAHLAGWPVGSGELTELLEANRVVCVVRECTLEEFERTINSRLGRARRFGAVKALPADHAWWDEGWRFPARQSLDACPSPLTNAPAGGTRQLKVVMLGTHGAIFNEIQMSWREAAKSADLCKCELSFAALWEGALYKVNDWLKHWTPQPPQLDKLQKELPFEMISHNYIDPMSSRNEVMKAVFSGDGDAIVLVCTIPAVTCASFAGLPFPIVAYLPAPMTVQVPQEHYAPWLMLVYRLVRDKKNHFIVTNPGTRAQGEHHLGIRLRVIPVLTLYVEARYSGWENRDVLVHDRSTTVLLPMLRLLTPEEFPLRFIGFRETDRQYSTFASHRAVVYLPGVWPEQVMFSEFYKMGLPILIPSDPGRYLWPRLHFSLGADSDKFGKDAPCGPFAAWKGRHQMSYKTPAGTIFANYTILCSGIVYVNAVRDGHEASEVARLVPMKAMDELGNTHALRAEGIGGHLASHGGRCVRFVRWPVAEFLRAFLGPTTEECPDTLQPGACEDGPSFCSSMYATLSKYVAAAPPALKAAADARIEPATFERGDFGATYHYLGGMTISRRRREPRLSTSPFDWGTHLSLRQWSHAVDLFRYPAVNHFLRAAELLRQLVEMQPRAASEEMMAFGRARRASALSAWRATLESVVRHKAQGKVFAKINSAWGR